MHSLRRVFQKSSRDVDWQRWADDLSAWTVRGDVASGITVRLTGTEARGKILLEPIGAEVE